MVRWIPWSLTSIGELYRYRFLFPPVGVCFITPISYDLRRPVSWDVQIKPGKPLLYRRHFIIELTPISEMNLKSRLISWYKPKRSLGNPWDRRSRRNALINWLTVPEKNFEE